MFSPYFSLFLLRSLLNPFTWELSEGERERHFASCGKQQSFSSPFFPVHVFSSGVQYLNAFAAAAAADAAAAAAAAAAAGTDSVRSSRATEDRVCACISRSWDVEKCSFLISLIVLGLGAKAR